MKVRYCNGQITELPDQNQGISLPMVMQAAKVDPARQQLVIHHPNGHNEILNAANIKTIRPDTILSSVMLRERGRES